jgi:hypothetical protein
MSVVAHAARCDCEPKPHSARTWPPIYPGVWNPLGLFPLTQHYSMYQPNTICNGWNTGTTISCKCIRPAPSGQQEDQSLG